MHRKLLEMSRRIRQLEDVLQIFQAMQSNNTHPLLEENHLMIKSLKNEEEEEDEKDNDDQGETAALTDAMGTLAIAESGEVRFMGRVSNEVRSTRYRATFRDSLTFVTRLYLW